MKIVISELAQKKIQHWVDKADFEVSGFGKVEYIPKDEAFLVTDAYLVKQEGGGAHTDIDQTALAQLMFKTKDIPGLLNFWWHSHVNMDVFWSGTDKSTIMELGGQGLCVATVFNKRRQMRSAVCAKMAGIFGEKVLFWDEITTTIGADSAVPEEWNKEFDDNVQRKKYPAPYTGPKSYLNENASDSSASWTKEMKEKWERDWEKDEYGIWQRKTPMTSPDNTLKNTTDTVGKTTIPSWAMREANLIDMPLLKYWKIITSFDLKEYMNVMDELEDACLDKKGVLYDFWSKDWAKQRDEAREKRWNT